MKIVDDDGYGDAAPEIRDRLERFERVLGRVRATRRGRPVSEVLSALEVESAAEGIEVWKEVAEDAARAISGRGSDRDTPERLARYLDRLALLTGATPAVHEVAPPGHGLGRVVAATCVDVPEPGYVTGFTYGLSLASHPEWGSGRRELSITVRSPHVGWAIAISGAQRFAAVVILCDAAVRAGKRHCRSPGAGDGRAVPFAHERAVSLMTWVFGRSCSGMRR